MLIELYIYIYIFFELPQKCFDRSCAGRGLAFARILNGWVDELDRPVYAKAKEIFERDLQTFGISHETCHSDT